MLEKLEKFSGRDGPLILIIMDGIGLGKKDESNAFHLANTPYLDKLQTKWPEKKLSQVLQREATSHTDQECEVASGNLFYLCRQYLSEQ